MFPQKPYGYESPPAWMRTPGLRGMSRPKWMEYYRTGENERKTVRLNGQTVRLGPNSMIPPMREPRDPWQEFWKRLQGPSGMAGVRG